MLRSLRLFAVAALIGLVAPSLGACTTFTQKFEAVASAVSGATVDPQAVLIASNTFDGLQRTATNYLRLKRCSAVSGPICRSPEATKKIIPAIRAGRVARNNLQLFLKQHPGALGPQGLYDSLQAAITTLQSVFDTYNIGGSS